MDILTAKIGANMAKRELVESGQVGNEEKTVVIPETTYDGEELIFRDVDNPLKEGETYTVVFDGVEYKSKCFVSPKVNITNGGMIVYCIGNVEAMSDVEEQYRSDVPFMVYYNSGVRALGANEYNWDDSGHTVSVTLETIVPIDQKYLGGVCLPVVELSTTFSVNAVLTDAEGKVLNSAFEANTPIIMRCNVDLGANSTFDNTASVWIPLSSDGAKVFIASFGGVALQIVNPPGYTVWGCSIKQTEV